MTGHIKMSNKIVATYLLRTKSVRELKDVMKSVFLPGD